MLPDQKPDLTHLEFDAIRYTDRYVPRAFIKKITKSHLNRENPASSLDWRNALNRGELFCISAITFDFFVSLEYEYTTFACPV
jgi:hypothetical protein